MTDDVDLLLRRFDEPDETLHFTRGRFEIVRMGDRAIGRATYAPGWRWSDHVREASGPARCAVAHLGIVIAGRVHVSFDDGREIEMSAGMVFQTPAVPHDSWVVGDEDYVSLHLLNAEQYAKT